MNTKYFKYIVSFALLTVGFSMTSMAQGNRPVTVEFFVDGTCDMCEERIEKALDVKGVLYADYELDEHKLEVTYKPHKISEEKIHKLLNAVGHDTEKSKASDAEYNAIHHCCKYRDHDCSKGGH